MITDLDETIRQLLKDELPIKNGEIDIKFDQPKREWSARLNKPTVNFYLYDIRENHILRQHQWERMPNNGGGRLNIAAMKRTPFRVDCYYMMTTWATEAEDEHRLLSRCLAVLFRHPILPAQRLVGALKTQPFDIQARLAAHDKLTNPAEVWSALDNEIRPSVSYLVTLAIDPWETIEGPIVRSFSTRVGQATDLPGRRELDPGGLASEKTYIGGFVVDKGKEKDPLPGVEVAIRGTGFMATTDAAGRYTLGPLPNGEHTLVAWREAGKPVQRKINVPPGEKDNYNLEL